MIGIGAHPAIIRPAVPRARRAVAGVPSLTVLALLVPSLLLPAPGAAAEPREWVTVPQVQSGPVTAPEPGAIIRRSSLIESPVIQADSPDVALTTASNTTQSENSIFVDPTNPLRLLASSNSSDWPVSQIYGADWWLSTDGGQSWTGSVFGPGGANAGDPGTGINRNGRLYVNYIALDYGQGIAWSDNDGASWTTATVAPGPYLLDKNQMTVDNAAASPYQGNLYVAWTNFQGGANDSEIELRRSTNGGSAWSSSINLSSAVAAGSHNQGVNVQVGPNGDVYVVWTIYDAWPADEDALGFARSTDGGATWSPGARILTNIRGHRNTALGGGKTMRHNSFPSMCVNQQTGEISVVWTNIGVPGVNTGDPDIYRISSTDGGATWSTPQRVNQDTQGNGLDQWFPWITCDASTGLLACIFYDSRSFPANDMAEAWVATSTDGGATWTDARVADAAWSGDGIPGFSGSYAGDYLGIAASNNNVYPLWSDTRAGNMLAYTSPFTVGPAQPPVADFSGNPTSGNAPLTVQFTDLSTNGPTSWAWDFGDGGTSTAQNPSHVYASAGTYDVGLTATNSAGSDTATKPGYITVQTPPAPVADFSGSPTSGNAPLTVQFTDLSTNGPTSWAWTFGDGGTSTAQNPSHVYASAGTYDVDLTATNSAGSDTATKPGYITVSTPPANNIHVQDITVTRFQQGRNWTAQAAVTIVDELGAPVAGASVSGFFNAPNNKTRSGTTGSDGVATISSQKDKTPPVSWCFTVTDVSLSGETYDPTQNVETTDCDAAPAAQPLVTGGVALDLGGAARATVSSSRSGAHVQLSLTETAEVKIDVYDVAGRRVDSIAEGRIAAGERSFSWNADGAPSGVYFVRVDVNGRTAASRVVVIR